MVPSLSKIENYEDVESNSLNLNVGTGYYRVKINNSQYFFLILY